MRGGEHRHETHTRETSPMLPASKKPPSPRSSQTHNVQGALFAGTHQMVPQDNNTSYTDMHTRSPYPAPNVPIHRSRVPYPPPRHPPAAFTQSARQWRDEGSLSAYEKARPPSYVKISGFSTLPPRGSEIFRHSDHSKSNKLSGNTQEKEHFRPAGSSRNINRCATYPAPNMDHPKRKLNAISEGEQFSPKQDTDRGAIHMTPSLDSAVYTKKQRIFYHENPVVGDMRQLERRQDQPWAEDYREGTHYQPTRHSVRNRSYDRPSMSLSDVLQENTGYRRVGHGHPPPPYNMSSRIVSWEGRQPPPPHDSKIDARVRSEFEPPRSPNLRRPSAQKRVLQARPVTGPSTELPPSGNPNGSNQRSLNASTVQEPRDTNVIPRKDYFCDSKDAREQTYSYDTHGSILYTRGKHHPLERHGGYERHVNFHENEQIKMQHHGDVYRYSPRTDRATRTTHARNAWGTESNDPKHGVSLSERDATDTRDGSELERIDYSCRPVILRQEGGHFTNVRQTEILVRNPSFSDTRDDMQTYSRENEAAGRYDVPPVPSITATREDFSDHAEKRDDVNGEDEMKPFIITQDQMRTKSGILLLAQPQDRISLSETLSMVRENIEVFTATPADVDAPAPGRKRPVVVDQVGLRCIHCRDAIHQGERVKRAVCFPSSIKRIYRTVIDMKLDHFQSCKFVPSRLKDRLNELKANNTRSTGTTMHYFVQAAKRMGMVDSQNGVKFADEHQDPHQMQENAPGEGRASESMAECVSHPSSISFPSNSKSEEITHSDDNIRDSADVPRCRSDSSATNDIDPVASSVSTGTTPGYVSKEKNDLRKTDTTANKDDTVITRRGSICTGTERFHTGKVLLALEDDKTALSPLRCFLRENVYAFSATSEDIAVRTPTTFSVVLDQVGIGCIHCLSLPAKERSNRAVCFPFSVGRIYQSVADIQRFHLGECPMVPEYVKQKFISLQNASSKGSKGLATRQYWVSSAKKLGLVDTPSGIRFSRDPSIPIAPAVSLDILAQVASDVTTASRPLVLPEDKETIAEFLYVVMEQLQPCRFTEADRNKRRLKDVGCIGVECKHCAGQVEGRKFFWSSVNAVESNFVSVHTHMMECRMIPNEIKDQLAELKKLRKEQTSSLKTGSQKAFFARVWQRLHNDGGGLSKSPETSQKVKTVKPSMQKVPCKIEEMSVVAV